MRTHAKTACSCIQIISACSILLSAGCFWLLHGNLLFIVVAAVVGIIAYGKKTLMRPLRTFTYMKPLAVGCGIAFFAWYVVGMPANIAPMIGIAFVCTADALLCDIDDCAFDVATGCQTLANQLGAAWAWGICVLLYTLAMSFFTPVVGLGFMFLFPLPLLVRTIDVRFIVDVRPLLILLLAWVL